MRRECGLGIAPEVRDRDWKVTLRYLGDIGLQPVEKVRSAGNSSILGGLEADSKQNRFLDTWFPPAYYAGRSDRQAQIRGLCESGVVAFATKP